jgi:hypothetical protein
MKTQIGMLATLLAAIACSNADPADEARAEVIPPTKAEQPLVGTEAPATEATSTQQVCRQFMQRQRTCGDIFIPALVDARVKRKDRPEIAELDAKIGRDALVKQAFEEWANDSRDDAIDSKCDHIARAVLANGRDAELRSGVEACMANSGCDAFVACSVPLNFGHWKEAL